MSVNVAPTKWRDQGIATAVSPIIEVYFAVRRAKRPLGRGASRRRGLAMENTVVAISRSYALGVRRIELMCGSAQMAAFAFTTPRCVA